MATVLALGFWQLGAGAWIPAKAMLAQALLQHAWDSAETKTSRNKPWPWADTWPYARLTAPDKAIDLIVLAGGSGRTLAFGPGLLFAGAEPGENGNTIIAGHRDTHFAFLRDAEAGDRIRLETPGGERFEYRIDSVDVVDSNRAQLVVDTPEPRLTLVTCYPFDALEAGGPLRYVVGAALLQREPATTASIPPTQGDVN